MALGANLGDPHAQLRRAVERLAALGTVAARSAIYETAPVGGPLGQPPYLNAVLELRPRPELDEPRRLMTALLAIERELGRVRAERWGPRVIDLDLLDLGGLVVALEGVSLPHPRLHERAFVLAPLCEVAPAWRHPLLGEDACALLDRLPRSGVRRTDLAW